MSKQITLNYEGKTYTLEYTRRTVMQMENEGFVAQDIDKKPANMLPALFSGAFKANHKYVDQGVIDKIYASMGDKETLIQKLAEMYNEPIAALLADPNEEDETTDVKKVEWETNW